MEPKITVAEIVLILPVAVGADLMSFVPGLGTIVSIAASLSLWIYLRLKGVPPVGPLIVSLADIIPIIGLLTLITFAFLLAVAIDRIPALNKAARIARIDQRIAKLKPGAGAVGNRTVAQQLKAQRRARRKINQLEAERDNIDQEFDIAA